MSVDTPDRRAPRRYPFLPPRTNLGWTPYAWLVYLSFFFIDPLFNPDNPPWEVAATAAVAAVFLPLYFWGHWLRGPRVLVPATAIAVLGTVATPWNQGASVFFIYASGFLGWVGPPRLGSRFLAVLLAWIAAVGWIFHMNAIWWVVAMVFSVLIAGINIHFAEMSRRDADLRRSQEEVERLAQTAERERIGRDLHDLLGHTLSLITLKAELAGRLLEQDPQRAGSEVADIERISRRALREVREAVAGYRASGFAAEVERAAGALAAAGVTCERVLEPRALAAVPADAERERALSFAVREAVTNVVRHAGARHCEIAFTLGEDGDDFVLTVADDGRGGLAAEGWGLSGLRQRLAPLGGTLVREGDGGTRLVVRLPRAPEADDDDDDQTAPAATDLATAAEGTA